MKIQLIVILSCLLLATLAGCTKIEKVYVCANGKEVGNISSCPMNKVAGVKKLEAEEYAKNFVNAYFLPYGGKSQLVSSFLDPNKGDYFATFIVASKDSSPYQTIVCVDGITGIVNCTQNCKYIS
jgi:hypothetical protein